MDSLKHQEILVRKLKLGPSNRKMIPIIPHVPSMFGFRRSPGRFYRGFTVT